MKKSYVSLGLMSGTSVDGIDVAISEHEIKGEAISTRLIYGLSVPLKDSTVKTIFELFDDSSGSIEKLTLLNMDLGLEFANAAIQAVNNAGLKSSDIDIIGSHGQTIRHIASNPHDKHRASLQIGSGALIASKTGIITACDFRSSDIAAGGIGAPLVPFFDTMMAKTLPKPIVFQNYGGIGNVSFISDKAEIIAFDTGPGNMIIDKLVYVSTNGHHRYDKDGFLGSSGRLIPKLLDKWMQHSFISKLPPKSCGREEFGTAFYTNELSPLLDSGLPPADLIKTAEVFTATATAHAYKQFLPELPKKVIVSGGGAHNPIIMLELQAMLPECDVIKADDIGLSCDYKEAMAFGLLGLCRLLGLANTVPKATGASKAISSGGLYLP